MPDRKYTKLGLASLSFGALGVVFGDIGTSPLYAVNQIFFGRAHPERTATNILSMISLVVWSLLVVVSFKYVIWVLKADNEGEGGVFALLALLRRYKGQVIAGLSVLLILAAGLLFGDGIITPAISVLSAVEGLKVITPAFTPYVIPLTVVIITALFAIQQHGTHKIGRLFGPIILLWFLALAILGLRQIVHEPAIIHAFNPVYALRAFTLFPLTKLLIILGSVMLVVTGGEALYADMGHFGRLPIRISWFSIVLPALLLNYLGQGAFLLRGQPVIGSNLFYSMVPSVFLVPMVILACFATIIASQALISGAFSLAAQGIALGLLPRLRIKHTHEHHAGQIYISFVNWSLYVGCILLVFTFKSSGRLASAYGLAVSGVMVATTLSMIVIARRVWHWRQAVAVAVFVPLAVIDVLFLTANSLKFLEGGFIPLTIGLLLYIIMSTWQWGKQHWRRTLSEHATITMQQLLDYKKSVKVPLERSLLILTNEHPGNNNDAAPALLELYIDRYRTLPRHVIILTISQIRKPHIEHADRYVITEYENDRASDRSLLAIKARFGFLEEPDVEKVIADIADDNHLTPNDTMKDWIIYVARERVISARKPRVPSRLIRLRTLLYSILISNCTPAYEYYNLGEDSRLNAELIPVRISR